MDQPQQLTVENYQLGIGRDDAEQALCLIMVASELECGSQAVEHVSQGRYDGHDLYLAEENGATVCFRNLNPKAATALIECRTVMIQLGPQGPFNVIDQIEVQ